jgi:hypothetical protein
MLLGLSGSGMYLGLVEKGTELTEVKGNAMKCPIKG